MIRPATLADISSIIRLECECATAAHWTEAQYRQALEVEDPKRKGPTRLLLVAHDLSPTSSGLEISAGAGTNILGFLVALHLAPEWELENIVVASAERRKGLGKRLMDALLSAARRANSMTVFLEVRESNAAARTLYEKAGFEQTGRRKSYYTNPMEDSVLYRRTLANAR